MRVTTSPRARNRRWPRGTRSTKTANATWRPRPHATTRRLIARRFRDSPTPMTRIAAMPITPTSRAPRGRGATAGGAGGVGTTCAAGSWARGPIAACTEFQANRGTVKTSSAHTNVAEKANRVRRNGMRGEDLTRGEGRRNSTRTRRPARISLPYEGGNDGGDDPEGGLLLHHRGEQARGGNAPARHAANGGRQPALVPRVPERTQGADRFRPGGRGGVPRGRKAREDQAQQAEDGVPDRGRRPHRRHRRCDGEARCGEGQRDGSDGCLRGHGAVRRDSVGEAPRRAPRGVGARGA